MKYSLFPVIIFFLFLSSTDLLSQKTYSSSVFEFIFSYGTVGLSDDFISEYPMAEITQSNLRFTAFFHLEEDWHLDLTNNIGFITGFGIRNIGLSTDELLPVNIGENRVDNYKIVRRIYSAGIPLLLKIGSFKNHLFLYAGGEYELALHYKEKYWSGTQNRSGSKTKYSLWLGNQTPLLLPSFVAGIQLPGGINIKYKYYFNDFLNIQYSGQNSPDKYNVSDLSRYEFVKLSYISLSWQFSTDYLKGKDWHKKTEIAYK
jgi:hypothetical protein